MVERYAVALKTACGLECPLSAFSVDRAGWSPQLAAVLGHDYLGADAMRQAIILSPDQANAPLIGRRFSYEAALLERVYLEARPTLLNLIEQEAVIIELDPGLVACRTAADVAAIAQVNVAWNTARNTLGKTAALLELGSKLGEQSHLLDAGYLDRMLALVADVGDPRERVLPPGLGLAVAALWAEVAGGTYVLRMPRTPARSTLIIAGTLDAATEQLPGTALALDDIQVVDALHTAGWLRYVRTPELLGKRLAELERDALLNADEANPAVKAADRRRQFSRNAAAQAALSPVYWELDAEAKRFQANLPWEPQRLSPAARWALSTPTRAADVVMHLLARFVPYDYALFAHHHRRRIETEWGTYTPAKQRYLETAIPQLAQGFVATNAAPATS